ncbi:MAG: TolC family protein [Myxococcaceae bacterium]
MIAATLVLVTLSQAGAAPLLTFDDALKLAEEKNQDLKVAQARLGQAQLISRKVWANYLPQLSVAGGYTRNSTEAIFPVAVAYYVRETGMPGPPMDEQHPGQPTTLLAAGVAQAVSITIQPLNQWAGQAKLSQAIIAPALWPAIRASHLGEEVASLSVENARREILFGAAQLYYGAAGLKEALKVQRRILESFIAHEKDAKIRYEAGALPKVAFLRSEIDRVRAEQDLKRSENGFASTKSALSTLLDREGDFDVALPAEPALPADLSELSAKAAADRPDLKAARKSVDLAEVQRSGVYYQYAPNIGLNAQFQIANLTGFTGEQATWTVGVGASWTLWDGGLREVLLKENELKVVESRAARRSAELKADDELRRSLLDLDSAKANKVKAAEQLELARENMSLVNVSYESGAATYLEVTDANASLLGAEINFVAEGLNASLAALKVLKAAGQFAAR